MWEATIQELVEAPEPILEPQLDVIDIQLLEDYPELLVTAWTNLTH